MIGRIAQEARTALVALRKLAVSLRVCGWSNGPGVPNVDLMLSRSVLVHFKPSSQLVLGLGLAAALVVILGLLNRVGDLRAEYAKVRRRLAALHEGAFVPSLRLATIGGDSVTLGEPTEAGRQLVFVFNTRCPFCKATLPAWDSLADSVRRLDRGIQVLGLAIDSVGKVRSYVAANRLGYPMVSLTTVREVALYRAGTVPQTVVIGHGGRVRFATVGQLVSSAVLDSVYRALAPGSLSQAVPVSRR